MKMGRRTGVNQNFITSLTLSIITSVVIITAVVAIVAA